MSDDLNISLNDVEPLVREAFTAAVARDPGRSAQALEAMGTKATQGIALATVINVHALELTGTQGDDPTAQTLRVVVDRFMQLEAWAQFNPDDVLDYVYLIAISSPPGSRTMLTPDVMSRLVFVMGAHLLSAYASEPWYERLDTILNRIEAARG